MSLTDGNGEHEAQENEQVDIEETDWMIEKLELSELDLVIGG